MTRLSVRFDQPVSGGIMRVIKRVCGAARRAAPSFFKGMPLPREITILFISSAFSRKLNRIYCAKNKSTNVLSFVYDAAYAEIFIAPAVVRKEATQSGEVFEYALVKLIIHGIIHCSGMNHEGSARKEQAFEVLEQKFFERVYNGRA